MNYWPECIDIWHGVSWGKEIQVLWVINDHALKTDKFLYRFIAKNLKHLFFHESLV